jgi:hypothetical protein
MKSEHKNQRNRMGKRGKGVAYLAAMQHWCHADAWGKERAGTRSCSLLQLPRGKEKMLWMSAGQDERGGINTMGHTLTLCAKDDAEEQLFCLSL